MTSPTFELLAMCLAVVGLLAILIFALIGNLRERRAYPLKYRWYVWENGRRINLAGLRDRPPNWLERFHVWALRCPYYGRLCWVSVDPVMDRIITTGLRSCARNGLLPDDTQ